MTLDQSDARKIAFSGDSTGYLTCDTLMITNELQRIEKDEIRLQNKKYLLDYRHNLYEALERRALRIGPRQAAPFFKSEEVCL